MPASYPYPIGYEGTQGTVWYNWVQQTGTQISNAYAVPAMTIGTSSSANVWIAWNTNVTTIASQQQTTQQLIWDYWNVTGGTALANTFLPIDRPTLRELSAEEQWKVRQGEIRSKNRARARMLRRKQANDRADLLLREHLTDEQRAEWASSKAFHVETADGRRRYRLALGMSHNVRVVRCADEDALPVAYGRMREGARLCAHVYHPDEWVPDADNVLAQKFMLESNEEQFLAMANAS